jgi:hypothetical protein
MRSLWRGELTRKVCKLRGGGVKRGLVGAEARGIRARALAQCAQRAERAVQRGRRGARVRAQAVEYNRERGTQRGQRVREMRRIWHEVGERLEAWVSWRRAEERKGGTHEVERVERGRAFARGVRDVRVELRCARRELAGGARRERWERDGACAVERRWRKCVAHGTVLVCVAGVDVECGVRNVRGRVDGREGFAGFGGAHGRHGGVWVCGSGGGELERGGQGDRAGTGCAW